MYAIFRMEMLTSPMTTSTRIGGPPRKMGKPRYTLSKTDFPKFGTAGKAAEFMHGVDDDGCQYVIMPYFDKRATTG